MLGGVDWRSVCVRLQTYLVRWSSERTVGWGLVGLTVMMGATYAMRDHIKEAFHRWLAGHVYRLYAQRVVRCFMPDHLVTPRQTIVHEPLSGSDVFEKTAWQMHAHDCGRRRQ